MSSLKAPFPWFGGKRNVADLIWRAIGDPDRYIEPFSGSAIVTLRRPDFEGHRIEILNDADGLLQNLWRAIRMDPSGIYEYCLDPIHECDLHARHAWLLGQRENITRRLEGDPEWYDLKAAGWWLWGICCWIGGGWCKPGGGPWSVVDGELVKGGALCGVKRKLPHMRGGGMGVVGVARQIPLLRRQGRTGAAAVDPDTLLSYLKGLSGRLSRVTLVCGDWSRVLGPSVVFDGAHSVGVYLDPPFDAAVRHSVYGVESDPSSAVREWALSIGDDPRVRVVLSGYASEHAEHMPDTWKSIQRKPPAGYQNQGDGRGNENRRKEYLWFSPYCLPVEEA